MGFLEAISMGKYIVSNDDSTMNEYITDNKIGFLINENNKKLINYDDVINNVNYRIQFAKEGYVKWSEEKNKIMNFFLRNLDKVKKNLFIEALFFLDIMKFYIKKFYKK